jgi:hypothetical protein
VVEDVPPEQPAINATAAVVYSAEVIKRIDVILLRQ